MGQQQILLIVLAVIVVGIAVVIALTLFSTNSTTTNREAIIAGLTNLATVAQSYNLHPANLGGGGNSFTGWSIPPSLASTADGTYTVTVTANSVTIVGVGNQLGNDGSTNVKVTMVVSSNAITSTTINN
jgi:hypothetical protein